MSICFEWMNEWEKLGRKIACFLATELETSVIGTGRNGKMRQNGESIE